jgi:hypothetical protein
MLPHEGLASEEFGPQNCTWLWAPAYVAREPTSSSAFAP